MKLILPLLIVLMAWNAVAQPAPAIKRNSFTTNSDPAALGIVTNIAEALLNAPTNGVTALQATNIANALINASSNVNLLPFVDVRRHGITTNLSAADQLFRLNVLLTNLFTAYGGANIYLPSGTRFTNGSSDALIIPDNGARPPHSGTWIFSSDGAHNAGQSVAPPGGVGVIDFDMTNGFGQIRMHGLGVLRMRNMFGRSLHDTNTPFLYTTMGTIDVQDTSWRGPVSSTNAFKKWWVAGGSGLSDFATNGADGSFQGYVSIVQNNSFDRIATVFTLNGHANATRIEGNWFRHGVGANLSDGWFGIARTNAVDAGATVGIQFINNVVECNRYRRMWLIDGATLFYAHGNQWYDFDTNLNTVVYTVTNGASGVWIADTFRDTRSRWFDDPEKAVIRHDTSESGATNFIRNNIDLEGGVNIQGNGVLRQFSSTGSYSARQRLTAGFIDYFTWPNGDVSNYHRVDINGGVQTYFYYGTTRTDFQTDTMFDFKDPVRFSNISSNNAPVSYAAITSNGDIVETWHPTNNIVVVAGAGGITITESIASGVKTYTVNDDDAGGGGSAANEPAVRVWQATYDATLDVEATNAYSFTSSTNFTVTLSGTAVDGQSVLFSVSNSHATANLTMTISPSVYDAVSKSTISTEIVSSNAVSHYEFRFMTNFIGGGRWEFIRTAVPQLSLVFGDNIKRETNGALGTLSVDVATLLSNLTAVKYAVHIPPVTASNILVTATTNVHELVGLTNVVLTNIVEQATGASGSVEVHIRNTQSGSIPVVLPAFGSQHGYYFHTNGLNDVLSASIAPPGTNTVWSMRVVGTNVYPSVTYWRHP